MGKEEYFMYVENKWRGVWRFLCYLWKRGG